MQLRQDDSQGRDRIDRERSAVTALLTENERKFVAYYNRGGMPLQAALKFWLTIVATSALISIPAVKMKAVWLLVADHLVLFVWIGLFVFMTSYNTVMAGRILSKYDAFIDELARREAHSG